MIRALWLGFALMVLAATQAQAGLTQLDELAAVARRYQCGLSFRAVPELDGAALEQVARATAGRFYCKMTIDATGGKVPPNTGDVRERLEFLAAHLA